MSTNNPNRIVEAADYQNGVKPVNVADLISTYSYLKESVYLRVEDAIQTLKNTNIKVSDDMRSLNELGELQSEFATLDCQLAVLATQRRMLTTILGLSN